MIHPAKVREALWHAAIAYGMATNDTHRTWLMGVIDAYAGLLGIGVYVV